MGIFQKIGSIIGDILKPKAMNFGIDVSHHNGMIDWSMVVKNEPKVEFVFVKSSEGIGTTDHRLFQNVAGAIKYCIPFGCYHFATWNMRDVIADAKAEANYFINTVQKLGVKPDLPMVLDIETNQTSLPFTKQQVYDYVKTFLGVVVNAGYDVAIYSSPGFINSFLPQDHKLGVFNLIVADYSGVINPCNGWKKIWLHQFSDNGKIAGINTRCDLIKSP